MHCHSSHKYTNALGRTERYMVRMTMRCKREFFSVDDLKRLHLRFKKSYHSSLHRDEDAKFIKHHDDIRTHYPERSAYPSARTALALWSPIQCYRSVTRLMRRLPTPHRVWRSCTHQTNTETCKETTELIILPKGLPVQRFKFSLTGSNKARRIPTVIRRASIPVIIR